MSDGLENITVLRRETSGLGLEYRICHPPHGTDVMFAVLRAAVCGTDRQIVRGVRGDRAAILGHEGVAEVARIGSEVKSIQVGERFVFNPVNPEEQDEILGHSTEGIFQRYFTISEEELERRSLLVGVPDGLATDACVLAEPLGTVVYTHELLNTVRRPESILILGAGAMGILHALYAHRVRGVPDVGVVCNRKSRADWLRGRKIVPDAVHLFEAEALADIDRSMPAIDTVLFCLPARATTRALRLAAHVVMDHGCIGLIGGVDRAQLDELPGLDLVEVRRAHACGESGGAKLTETVTATGKPVHVFGHRGTAARHLRTALDALATEPALVRVLTHKIAIGALPDVLSTLCDRSTLVGTEYLKGVVDCTADGDAVVPLLEEAPE